MGAEIIPLFIAALGVIGSAASIVSLVITLKSPAKKTQGDDQNRSNDQ